MTKPPGKHTNKHARISREELDRLFDRELNGRERRDIVGRLGRDPSALDEVSDVRRMVQQMRKSPGETPDLTLAVMDQLDQSSGFLSRRLRRRVKAGRLAAAAVVLVGLLGITIAQRTAPDRFRVRDVATPVADFSDALRQDSAEGSRRIANAMASLATADPVRIFARQPGQHFPGDHPAGNGSSMIGLRVSYETPECVPARYLTLSASADAEVLALNAGDSRGLTTITQTISSGNAFPVAFELRPIDLAVATSFDQQVGFEAPTATPATFKIRAGIVPLTQSPTGKAAYVGKRYLILPEILYDHQYGVSRRDQRP